MIPEMKLDESFPAGQVLMGGYIVPFRFDRDGNREWYFAVHEGRYTI